MVANHRAPLSPRVSVLMPTFNSGRFLRDAIESVLTQEFWFHLLLQGDFVYLPEPLCMFRQHRGQQTHVNQRIDVGPMESLLITVRYIDAVANPACGGFTPAERRQLLFSRLYYSRKHVPRSPGILVAEEAVRARLSLGWRLLLWWRHRLIKPWLNLRRFVARRFGTAPADYTDFDRISRQVAQEQPPLPRQNHDGLARPPRDLMRRHLSPTASPRASAPALRPR